MNRLIPALTTPLSLALAALALSPLTVLAQQDADDESFAISGNVEVGAEYNDNLNVDELESASGRSDAAAVFDGGVDLAWEGTKGMSALAGYSYSASRYQDVDGFDLDMHLLFADLSHDFDWLTLGGNYYFADASLGGDDFLTLNQYSLYAGKLLGERWYLRGALNFADKSFDTFSERDADNDGYSLEGFWFFDEGRGNVMLGYAFEDEKTRTDPFIYAADTLRLRYSQRFTLLSLDARLQLGLRWQDRNYAHATPSIGVPRDDSQRVSDLRLDVSVLENLEVIGRWEHGDYRSRLTSADYTAHRLTLSARLAF